MTTLERPETKSPKSTHERHIEAPVSLTTSRTRLISVGSFVSFVILLLAISKAPSWGPLDRDLAVIALIPLFGFVQWKFATNYVIISLTNEGIVERKKDQAPTRTIEWSDIEEYFCTRPYRYSPCMRIRRKSDGKLILYQGRGSRLSYRDAFDAFDAAMTAKVDQLNAAERAALVSAKV